MQLTTKTEYSVRALVLLSTDKMALKSITEICKKQKLPRKYVEQIFRKLKEKLIIDSVSGSKGGYYLLMKPTEITLGLIMEIVENHPYEVSCERNGNSQESEFCLFGECRYKTIWHEIYDHIKEYLNTITLNDIKNKLNK